MSSKSTIFLTSDNEHCYTDCNERVIKDGKYIGYTITLEMDKKNIRIIQNDEDALVIEIDPGSELYDIMINIKQ